MRKLVRVTAEHLAKGQRGDAHACPVALAVMALVKDEVEVWVQERHIDLDVWDGFFGPRLQGQRSKVSEAVMDAIVRIDNALPVEPFSFYLDIPEWALR